MNYSFDVLVAAHRHSSKHRSELERSKKCACFFCGETFGIKAVEEWVDDNSTAICPQCGVDAVIGSASRYPISNASFLSAMHRHWFE